MASQRQRQRPDRARGDRTPGAAAAAEPAAPSLRERLLGPGPAGLPAPSPVLVWLTFGLTLAGLGLSIYLTIVDLQPSVLVCSAHGLVNCENVLHSAEAKIFGVIPVAFLGLAFYAFACLLNSPWAWRRPEPLIRWGRLSAFIVGICFVLYLIYAELIEIGNICIWCTTVHCVTFVLFVLIVFDSAFRRPPLATSPQRR